MSELRDATNKRNDLHGEVEDLQKQVEELQEKLRDSQNQWSRCNDDAKTYMETAQSRQKMIDE